MIRKIICWVLLCLPIAGQAQIAISVQLPPSGLIQKEQLWNILLVNNGNEAIDVILYLNLQDAATGQTVMTAGSHFFSLNKGVKLLNERDVQPVQYHYTGGNMSGKYLPPGSYIACYTLERNFGQRKNQPIGEECVRLNITPLSPPLLTLPANQSTLKTTYPQFQWLPPTPVAMFDNLNYHILVAEIRVGQSAEEAILYNPPVYSKGHILLPIENYPTTNAALETGKSYAWQITANSGIYNKFITEVWRFKIAEDTVATSVSNDTYILLKQEQEASGINNISDKVLHLKYYSFDKEYSSKILIVNAEGKTVYSVNQKIHYGDNFFQIKLKNKLSTGKIYTVEITDLSKNKFKASFSIQ